MKAFNKLEEINFIDSKTGICNVDINTLNTIRSVLPNIRLDCSFILFGQTVSSYSERIEYDTVEIGNEGLPEIREVLPYLTSCSYFLLADCGIDYELLSQLRDDFPEKNIVWRIQ